MQVKTLFAGEGLSVHAYKCSAGPADRPFAEVHARHSLSYVRRGSFGCRTLGAEHELIAGAVLVGRPGREYTATHEHHGCGDECLSITLSPEVAESLGGGSVWSLPSVPPLRELAVLGSLAQAAAEGRTGIGIDEAALAFAGRCAELAAGRAARRRIDARVRRRAVAAAIWLEARCGGPVRLEDAAREAGLSLFHFLRVFERVHGVTPHQYVLRLRLARAAKLLAEDCRSVTDVALEAGFADLSNFVRTFRRAAGMPPAAFRRASRAERKILQDRFARAA